MFDRVFVMCPRGMRTGGPEALHQLVDSLRRQGQDALLIPVPGTEASRLADWAEMYDAPWGVFDDDPSTAVVVPEPYMDELARIRRSRRYLWWLSIDNSPYFRARRVRDTGSSDERPGATRMTLMRARALISRVRLPPTALRDIEHLTQSAYAWNFLHDVVGIVPSALSDYTSPYFLRHKPSTSQRVGAITFNPAKSARIMERFAEENPDLELVSLDGLPRTQVLATLDRSLIYLDLGAHPGKDRLPREAASRGVVVISVRRGAAANDVDMPIPWEHKISPRGDVVMSARAAINAVLMDPEKARGRQDFYRERIGAEKRVFDEEVRDAFIRLRLETDPAMRLRPE